MIQNHQAVSALPVMVFLHGGGYVSGSGSRLLYGPELFMDRQVTKMSDWNSEIRFWKNEKIWKYLAENLLTQVVLVCLNFRLSVLGGLYLPGGKAPGNQMMRDQVKA